MAIVNFAWTRACVKAGLPDDPNYPDQQNMEAKRKKKNGNCMLNALPVLEDSVSICL